MNNNISVLIADDNEDLAKELSSYIGAKPNMTVTAIATDGEEAYTLISQTRPDIIILDLVMPKLDGIGVLKRMQTLTFDKKPKIIVYSVSSIAIKMAASVSPLIDYCLLKPQSNERVYEVIQDLTSVPMVSAIPLSHNITAQKAEETDLETIVTDFIHELGVPAPTKWADLWDERLSGEILMQDSIRSAFMTGLKKNGYSLNSTNPDEINKAKQDLIDQKPLVQAYVVDQVRDKMIGGEAAVGIIYSGEMLYIQGEDGTDNLEYVIPEEGTDLFIDCWVIPKNAKNKENAEKWINFLCRPDIAKKNFEYITYPTPNKGAFELLDEDMQNNKAVFPDIDSLKDSEVYQYLGDDTDAIYNELWKEVKAN